MARLLTQYLNFHRIERHPERVERAGAGAAIDFVNRNRSRRLAVYHAGRARRGLVAVQDLINVARPAQIDVHDYFYIIAGIRGTRVCDDDNLLVVQDSRKGHNPRSERRHTKLVVVTGDWPEIEASIA